jgi:hypothetical protein
MSFSHSVPNRVRVGGSGFTSFFWNQQPIAFCRMLAHTPPTPVGPGPTPIQPLDEPYPIDIVTPAAQTVGTLQLELYELYNRKVWDHLSIIAGSVDIVNIFIKVAASATPIQIVKVIQPPTLGGKTGGHSKGGKYFDIFHNCVITSVEDGETIEIGSMEITKRISVMYTHTTRDGYEVYDGKNYALEMRDGRTATVSNYATPA